MPGPVSLGADHVILAGRVSGPGKATIPAGTTATLTGTFLFAGGIHLVNKGVTEIQGSCDCFSSQGFTAASVLDNAGTLTLDDGVNLVPADGTANKVINEAGGTISYTGTAPIATTTIAVPLTDDGTIQIASGTLAVGSPLTLSGKTLAIVIAGRTDFGKLSVTGTLTLRGTLAIRTAAGYLPVISTTIAIVSATTRAGTFSSIIEAHLTGRKWDVSYLATGVRLKAVAG